jgi:hypothetical protein
MRTKIIRVLAATSQSQFENDGADVVNDNCETIAEAKKRAKYYLTRQYMVASESTELLTYSRVEVDGELKYDYFSSGK